MCFLPILTLLDSNKVEFFVHHFQNQSEKLNPSSKLDVTGFSSPSRIALPENNTFFNSNQLTIARILYY